MAVAAKKTARKLMGEFIAAYVTGDEIDTLEILAAAHDHFDSDRTFQRLLYEEALRTLVSTELEAFAHRRRDVRFADVRDGRVLALLSRVFEPVGDNLRRSIPSMTRRDLLAAAAERRRQASGHIAWAAFEEHLASRLPDDDTTVADHFSEHDIAAAWQRHFAPASAA